MFSLETRDKNKKENGLKISTKKITLCNKNHHGLQENKKLKSFMKGMVHSANVFPSFPCQLRTEKANIHVFSHLTHSDHDITIIASRAVEDHFIHSHHPSQINLPPPQVRRSPEVSIYCTGTSISIWCSTYWLSESKVSLN